MAAFDRPIPGQSLTSGPRANPYERAPEVNDPEEALQVHLAGLAKTKPMAAALNLLAEGVDLVTLVEGILRNGVMRGLHSVDVSLIIAPAIHEFIKTTADAVGIEYEEGFEDKEESERLTYSYRESDARRQLAKMKVEPQEVAEAVVAQEETMPEETKPRGLMARM